VRFDGGDHVSGFVLRGAELPARRNPIGYRGREPQCAIIAAVKPWHAVLSALLFFIPPGATGADDVSGAARELARKTAAFAGRGAQVAITWRDLSPVETAAAQSRTAFEGALEEAGLRVGEVAPSAELRVTVSGTAEQFLLVEEAVKGEEHQVWIASWKRGETTDGSARGAALEKKLVWEQDEQILDIAFPAAGMLVLSASNVTLYAHAGGQWESQRAIPLAPAQPWPRDLRGHVRVKGSAFQALLPGTLCTGAVEPALSMECHASDEPWVVESGSRALLLASFAAARNYFEGHITTQTAQRKTVAPFFSAASVESQGRTWWLLASTDGRVQFLDAALDPTHSAAQWGSEIAGTDAHCGAGTQVLATRPGDRGQPDGIQAFTMAGHTPEPLTEPVDFPGPVMALWTSGGNAALAIVKDLRTGRYAAYMVTVVCGG
jgi:hypothetical protein